MRTLVKPVCTLRDTTKQLRNKYNCVGIKTSFEDEGASFRDIVTLRALTAEHGLKLAIKIGGAEAKTDIRNAIDLCCDSIVGPMIETTYALEKYDQATKNCEIPKGVNLETITALNNIDLLLTSQAIQNIDYFVVGRVDLIGSLGKDRSTIDSPETQKIVETAFTKLKITKQPTYLGGALSKSSKKFIQTLYTKGLLDYIETRFVILKLTPDFFNVYDEAIKTSHEFELKWSEHLYKKYAAISTSLNSRITLIQSRILRSFSIQGHQVYYSLNDIRSSTLNIRASPCDYAIEFIHCDINTYIQPNDFVIVDSKLSGYIHSDFIYSVDAREENKSIDTVMEIVGIMCNRNFTRIVVVGGGLVQDVGAFVSSIMNRGMEWIYFPTTLLAMSDSCIGSKTSLNIPGVKNKIGTFTSPKKIYINPKFLNTLDYQDIQSGKGEILKLCMIGNALDEYEMYKDDITQLIKLALIIKRSVIEIDQYDKNIRRALNYGHTVGHAIESMSNFEIPHGISVVYGMLVVNRLFGNTNDRFEKMCYELIPLYTPDIQMSNLKTILLNDKKASDNTVSFIIVMKPGESVFVRTEITDDLCSKIKKYLYN